MPPVRRKRQTNRSTPYKTRVTSIRNDFPVQVKSKPIQNRVFRFMTSACNAVPIFRRSLLSLLAASTTSGTGGNLITLIGAIKINQVVIWAGTPISGNFTSITLEWQDLRGSNSQVTDTGSLSKPAHVVGKPEAASTAAMWSNVIATGFYNEPIMNITCEADSIIDLHVSYVLTDGGAPNFITRTTGVAQIIALYTGYLDNSSASNTAGTNLITPVGLTTITYNN